MCIYKVIITVAVICSFTFGIADGSHKEKMKLEDLQAITLHEGNEATTRRFSDRVPQLVCIGGNAGCRDYRPKVVLCTNKGWDGYNIQWECKADMPERYSFGTISVICEGYDYPEDPYILKGSCSLEYRLDYSNAEYQYQGKNANFKASDPNQNESQLFVVLIVVLLVVFGYIIYSQFLSSGITPHRTARRPSHGPVNIGWNIPRSDQWEKSYAGFHPPTYGSNEGECNQFGNKDNQGPGFWTGLGTGGILGYMFGRRNMEPRTSSSTPTTFGHGDSKKMRTATAYGGTSRR